MKEHVSTMEVKAAMTSRVRVNTSEDHDDVQPEDFEFVNHSTLLMDGMNDLRTKEHLLDIKLWAEGKCFKVRLYNINVLLPFIFIILGKEKKISKLRNNVLDFL